MNTAVWIWLGLLVAFLIAEAACSLHLVSIWFGVGSLAALIAAALGADLWLQVTLFVVVSGGLLAALWPLAKKVMKPRITSTNVDAIIGSQGVVLKTIDNEEAVGQVKLGAMEWTARSAQGDVIPEGTHVRVDRIEGVKVFVTRT